MDISLSPEDIEILPNMKLFKPKDKSSELFDDILLFNSRIYTSSKIKFLPKIHTLKYEPSATFHL